jgi:CubicO group peptidase (beta-lactamase class C family)
MKDRKALIIFTFSILISLGIFFKSETIYLYDLVKTIVKIKRTKADITDYKYFDNIDIPKSKNPQSWPFHKDFNTVKSTDKLNTTHDRLGTIAYLIIKNDSLWYEKYYDGYNEESYSNSFSIAKSIVTGILGKAIDEGYIKDLDQKVGDFIPEYKNGLAAKLTVGDLSSMSSGMKWTEDYKNIFGVTARAYVGTGLEELIMSRPIIREPGKSFKYLSGDTQLLAMTIEKATGKKISSLAYDWFWNPIGAENNALWQVDNLKTNTEKAYCCFNSNARDFAKFGKLFKDYGYWNGEKLLDSSFVKKVTTKRFNESPHYGYGFWLGDYKGMEYFSMRGHLGQYVIVFPKENIMIVRLGKRNDKKTEANIYPDDQLTFIEEGLKMIKV